MCNNKFGRKKKFVFVEKSLTRKVLARKKCGKKVMKVNWYLELFVQRFVGLLVDNFGGKKGLKVTRERRKVLDDGLSWGGNVDAERLVLAFSF